MAMVLDAFASYIGDYLKQVDLKNFLADADRRNITDETVQLWVGQLKRAMYEAADILDPCQLKAMEKRGSSSADAGCRNPLLFCMRNPFHAREIGTRIKALNQRLDSIKQRSAPFNFINLGSYEDCHSSNAHASRHGNPSRETVGDFDRSAVVGDKIEEDTQALVSQIMQTGKDANNDIMVVAIVGVGGIGTTTLAQKNPARVCGTGRMANQVFTSANTHRHRTPHPGHHAAHTAMVTGQHQGTGSAHKHRATTTRAAALASKTSTPPHPRHVAPQRNDTGSPQPLDPKALEKTTFRVSNFCWDYTLAPKSLRLPMLLWV
ncbi:hypothetical protein TRIUR3_04336 [Triticum urartu]|uniref:Disease resistance N-terminal domain-containing protein n=1 Tax=Triticum urartu TaxID=4572 RepID=M7Z2A6_TRIUA|nr:hypothetical protein TRIUR3_04336 [Triticum urartu]